MSEFMKGEFRIVRKNKFIAAFIMFVMLLVAVPMLSTTVDAQRYYYYRDNAGRLHRTTRKPSWYRRHRNASNVGMATGAGAVIGALAGGGKGALIGAGGYGQPIMTGIRLDDVGMILEGAIPAAVLALLAQAVFEVLERTVVPRGLRLRR